MLPHTKATHPDITMAPCSHVLLPFLLPINPMPVAWPAPPPRHSFSLSSDGRDKCHRWDPEHLHTLPLQLLSEENEENIRTMAMPGTTQPKLSAASSKAWAVVHTANEWHPSAISALNQMKLGRAVQSNRIKMHMSMCVNTFCMLDKYHKTTEK